MTEALEGGEWSAERPGPHFTPGIDPVPTLQEAGWAPGPVWTGGKSRPHRDSIPDCPARSQSLYRLSFRAHNAERTIRELSTVMEICFGHVELFEFCHNGGNQ